MTETRGVADPDIAATRTHPLDAARVAELALWNAAQYRARHAYEDVKRRAAVAPAKRRRR
jgi:hypothetical protein